MAAEERRRLRNGAGPRRSTLAGGRVETLGAKCSKRIGVVHRVETACAHVRKIQPHGSFRNAGFGDQPLRKRGMEMVKIQSCSAVVCSAANGGVTESSSRAKWCGEKNGFCKRLVMV